MSSLFIDSLLVGQNLEKLLVGGGLSFPDVVIKSPDGRDMLMSSSMVQSGSIDQLEHYG